MVKISNNNHSPQPLMQGASLSKCEALKLVDSTGNKKTRLVLDGVEDQKLRICSRKRFCAITLFFDRIMTTIFSKIGYERKWVQIYIDEKGKTKRILLNVNSLARRTLLTKPKILRMSEKELVDALKQYAPRENPIAETEGFNKPVSEAASENNLDQDISKEAPRVILTGTMSAEEEETKDGFPVMDPLITGALYQMMQGVDEVFMQHKIRYWISFGTLLGAERHSGLIPWDDDIDLCIFPGDEEKLKKIEVINGLKTVGLEAADHWFGAKVFAIANHPKGKSHNLEGYKFKAPAIDLFFTKEDKDEEGAVGYSLKIKRAVTYWPKAFHQKDRLLLENGSFGRVRFGPVFVNGMIDAKPLLYRLYGEKCLQEATRQFDHIHEKPIEKRYVEMIDFRAPHYVEWEKLPSLKPVAWTLEG